MTLTHGAVSRLAAARRAAAAAAALHEDVCGAKVDVACESEMRATDRVRVRVRVSLCLRRGLRVRDAGYR